VGTNDEIARAPAVRAIRRAAPQAEQFEVPVRAGHFGLVVGSRAVARTWPTVIDFVKWKGGIIEQPSVLFPEEDQARAQDLEDIDEVEFDGPSPRHRRLLRRGDHGHRGGDAARQRQRRAGHPR
jgi:poly(3-hydroxyalkanoate) synthetase